MIPSTTTTTTTIERKSLLLRARQQTVVPNAIRVQCYTAITKLYYKFLCCTVLRLSNSFLLLADDWRDISISTTNNICWDLYLLSANIYFCSLPVDSSCYIKKTLYPNESTAANVVVRSSSFHYAAASAIRRPACIITYTKGSLLCTVQHALLILFLFYPSKSGRLMSCLISSRAFSLFLTIFTVSLNPSSSSYHIDDRTGAVGCQQAYILYIPKEYIECGLYTIET